MRTILVVAAPLVLLAACSESPSADADGDGKITMEEAAAKSKDFVKPQAGQYKVTAEIVDVKMPGAPPEMQEMLKTMVAKGANSHEYCLSKEDAEKGFEEVAKQSQQGDCAFEKFDAADGKLDAVMNCKSAAQGTARMTLTGNVTTTSSDMQMVMDATDPSGQKMTMTMKSSQQRIGDCKS